MRRHQKICCRCKQCSKQFKNVSSLKEHNCSKTEEVRNLSPDKKTTFTNVYILEAVSRNEQTSPSRDGVEAVSTRNERATSSKVNKQSKRKESL